MTTAQTIRLFALSVVVVSLSGVVYTGSALVYDRRVRQLGASHRQLYRRFIAVKLAGIALTALDLAHSL